MAKPEGAAALVRKMEVWDIEQCECPENIDCVMKAQESDGTSCPAGTTPKKGSQMLMPGDSVYAMKNARFFVLSKGKHKLQSILPPLYSILYPAHFRAITEPGCSERNRCYYACAVNAYRFKDTSGRVSSVPEYNLGCKEIPADCKDACFQ
jgi:hypothetical protein